jgi:phosphoribosyl-dephospho-CoA transferase
VWPLLDGVMDSSAVMPTWVRNQLVRLTLEGWQQLHASEWDAPDREVLSHWQTQNLPLVITHQCCDALQQQVSLGLPAPAQWLWRKLALMVSPSAIAQVQTFPRLHQIASAHALGKETLALANTLADGGVQAQVYGSYAWQFLTGLSYLHSSSDLDLILPVANLAQAEAVLPLLEKTRLAMRLDGEIAFASGHVVAWRELQQLLDGQVAQVLVKSRLQLALVTHDELTALTQQRAVRGHVG